MSIPSRVRNASLINISHASRKRGWQKTETPLPERKKPVAIIHHLQPPTNNGGIIKHSTQGRLANETEGAAAGADILKNLVARRAVYLSLRFRHLSSSLHQRSWPQWGGYQEDIIGVLCLRRDDTTQDTVCIRTPCVYFTPLLFYCVLYAVKAPLPPSR